VGVPDVVVNNAGIVINGPFLAHTEKDWQQIVGVNAPGITPPRRTGATSGQERGRSA
jgi:NAD(P)-dependent dehydrogenase (short-subunit alcohol dehydrogenase family)